MSPTTTLPARQSAPSAASEGTGAMQPLRFQAGSLSRVEGVFYDQSIVPAAGAQPYVQMSIPTGGWERTVYLLVSCTTAGNAAATAFQADAPWNAIGEITVRDARGNTIIGPVSGYDLMLQNKWLPCSAFNTDLATAPNYSATTGAGATGGSFSFMLPIDLELIGRDAIAALANGASNTALRVNLTLAASTAIYATAPTTLAAVRIRAFHDAWQQPPAAALNGRPYAQIPFGNGTFRQLTKVTYPTVVGEQRIDLNRKGNPIRGLILVFRTAAGARTSTATLLGSNLLQFMYEGTDLLSFTEDAWRFRMWQRNNVLAANFDTGVVVIDWASDFDGKTGGELREQWLRTQPGSRVELRINPTTVGQLDVITDEVVPAGDLVYQP